MKNIDVSPAITLGKSVWLLGNWDYREYLKRESMPCEKELLMLLWRCRPDQFLRLS